MFSDLFWAIYWIDVLSGLPSDLLGALFFGGIASLAAGFAYATYKHDVHGEDIPQAITRGFRMGVLWLGVILFMTTLVSFIPSKQTMYMMLGVKTTENVVDSPLGKKLQKIVDAEIDGYLKKLTPNSKE